MNADGGMGLTIWTLAALAVAAISGVAWSLAARARSRRARLAQASENARLQREREQRARDDLSARTFVQDDPGTTVVVTPYPPDLPPVDFRVQDPGGVKARAKLARAKRRGKKK